MSKNWAEVSSSDEESDTEDFIENATNAVMEGGPHFAAVKSNEPQSTLASDQTPIAPSHLTLAVTGSKTHTVRLEDFVDYLTRAGCNITSVYFGHAREGFMGYAKVVVNDEQSYMNGLALNGQSLFSNKIYTKEWIPNNKASSMPRNEQQPRHRGGDARQNGPQDARAFNRDSRTDRRGDASRFQRGGFNRSSSRDDDNAFSGRRQPGPGRNDRMDPGYIPTPPAPAAPPVPPSRPVIKLQQRTLPIEKIGEPVVNANIFGGAKPQDEKAYEVSACFSLAVPVAVCNSF